MSDELYFDYNASTPVDSEVLEAALAWMRQGYANPGAAHPEGRRAAAAIARAREQVAAGLGAKPSEIFFTSGGTESNNWAFAGSARRAGRGHVVVSAIEHKSVLNAARELEAQGFAVTYVRPGADGAVRVQDFESAIRPDTFLVSCMAANNETGVVQPVAAIGAVSRARAIPFHVDAVCALGKWPLQVDELGCTLLSLSSHKLYSPKGCGVLYVREGAPLEAWVKGCGQQGGMRGGSENTPGSVAFGRAFERLGEGAFGSLASIGALRDELWERLRERFPHVQRNGSGALLPNTLNVAFPGAFAPELVQGLGARGISVSGSVSSDGAEPSHVLVAMGKSPDIARASLRFSLGGGSSSHGVQRVVEALDACLAVPARPAGR